MVEDIIDAAAQVLTEDGYDGASTNRIAARAGVGIGSVYRYFADKEELVEAVVDRVTEQMERDVSDSIINAMTQPLEQSMRMTLNAIIGGLERNAPLLRVVIDELPRAGATHKLGKAETRLYEIGRAGLIRTLGPVPAAELASITYLLMSTMLALAVRIALERPSDLDRDDLIGHATGMLTGWLSQYRADRSPQELLDM
jgi:AcrR family transcriptional regulator